MDEAHGNNSEQYIEAGQNKGRGTGPQDVPALRLGRRIAFNRFKQEQGTATSGVAIATVTRDASPPRFLRLIRFVVGMALLGIAWAGILAVVMLAQTLTQPITRQHIITHLLFDAAVVGAVCLIAITVLGCLIVGAFCLALALTSRDWQ